MGLATSVESATLRSGPPSGGLRPSFAHHSPDLSESRDEGGSTSDWPTYKHDACRSGVTDEALTFPLQPVWVYVSPQPPRPAWPEPVKVINRLDFDYAPQLVIADGLVCFGSSSDDTIRALDAATGRERWHFITGGPVRLAPQIARGKVYAGSDDGFAYCLDAKTGKLVWRFRTGLRDDRLIGNERMIARWPVRTGVLVVDDPAGGGASTAYCAGGMWSSEGVYVYALEADTGKVIWCNDTSHITGDLRTLHMGEDFGTYGVCPQGALLASGNILLVPTGKGLPAGYDRRTGKLLYYHMEALYNSAGGTWITIKGDNFYTTSGGMYALQTGVLAGGFSYNGMPTLVRAGAGGVMSYPVYEKGRISVLPHIVNQQGKVLMRKAYELALAGETLLVGEDGAVAAEEKTTQREVWRAAVQGEARGLAVANGKLFVATHRGAIHCFGASGTLPPAIQDPARARRQQTSAPIPDNLAPALARLRKEGMDAGYALVLGDADGSWSLALAEQTQLQVVNVQTNEAAVRSLRERLLSTTTLYGSRVHAQAVDRLAALPFPPYFANCVLVAKPVAGLAAKELYRVLRPCGGLLLFPGYARPEADRLAREALASPTPTAMSRPMAEAKPGGSAAEDEVQTGEAGAFIRRGRLPGALDWDTPFAGDQRVRWPLRLVWFGGPGPALVLDRKEGNTMGQVANGRYFVQGPACLTAVDAYNGAMLWTRPMPKTGRYVNLTDEKDIIAGAPPVTDRNVGWSIWADGENVYCPLSGHLRGTNTSQSCIQLNARAGNQKKIFGTFDPPPRVSLKTPRTWRLDVDATHAGTATLAAASDGLKLTLTTRDPAVSEKDQWELFFDMRPFEARYGLYERGVFQIKVFPARATNDVARWQPGAGEAHPRITVTGKRTADGTETSVWIPWKEIETVAGGRPASFGFAAILDSNDATGNTSVARAYLFCDRSAGALNDGWANIGLNESAAGSEGARLPSVVAGPSDAAPKRVQVQGAARLVPMRQSEPGTEARLHPFTGERGPKFFQAGTFGCGGSAASATCVFMRSTALAIYDFADDSGMRHFDGIKPSCTVSMTAALGLLLSSEGRGGCECTTSFQTSLALAPVDERSNEDWAIFHDRAAQTQVRQAAINFGAPGDRRDADGTLWLRFPRIAGGSGQSLVPEGVSRLGIWRQSVPVGLSMPLQLEGYEGAAPHRVNADRTRIEGTDRPWIYASHYRGIRKVVFKLEFAQPLVSLSAGGTINLDGQLTEPVWQGEPQAVLSAGKTSIFLRHDAENLYIAARRPAVIDAKGKAWPWTAWTAPAEAVPIHFRDSFELFLGDTTAGRVVHLAVNPLGARFDALAGTSGVDLAWAGAWTSAVVADTNAFVAELAVPWKTLAAAGIARERLALNAMINTWDLTGGQGQRGEALVYLGSKGRTPCENFVPLGIGPPPAARRFTVRLHFCELDDDVKAGQRVFDVRLQGEPALKGFDIAREAGGARKAVVKEFQHVSAADTLTLEFSATGPVFAGSAVASGPVGVNPARGSAPLLSGLEVFDEAWPAASAGQ